MINRILENIDNEECYYVGNNGCLYQDLDKKELLVIKEEIERLNNIINSIEIEVRNTTEEMYKTLVKIDGRGYYSANLTRLDYLLDKIKELKGVDKE